MVQYGSNTGRHNRVTNDFLKLKRERVIKQLNAELTKGLTDKELMDYILKR